ncbi:MAG: LLM class flavin-dependent oxidoreductase [Chloroflexi bacterium]|nr:LLM class flavin-dependent oxidoreductase [Chloroflexota bacterium]
MNVGAIVRLGPQSPGGSPPGYAAIREMAQHMEQGAGLDSIWLYDHLLYRRQGEPTDGIWECWTMLSALAEATTRVALGTVVMCTPFRNPALLAKMAATLDEVSNGRFTLGVGAGWHQPEFDAFGVPFDHRVGRFEEALQIIAPLLRTGRVDFHGRYYQAPDCEIIPRGPRAGGPPLLVAGIRPRMLALTAQYADAWNTAWHTDAASAAVRLDGMRSACADARRDPASLRLTVCVTLAFPELGEQTPPTALTGTTEQLAESLQEYTDLGVSEIIFDVNPYTPQAFDRLAQAISRFRNEVRV